jgi:hypothetical protein
LRQFSDHLPSGMFTIYQWRVRKAYIYICRGSLN